MHFFFFKDEATVESGWHHSVWGDWAYQSPCWLKAWHISAACQNVSLLFRMTTTEIWKQKWKEASWKKKAVLLINYTPPPKKKPKHTLVLKREKKDRIKLETACVAEKSFDSSEYGTHIWWGHPWHAFENVTANKTYINSIWVCNRHF